jgi:hypothetical protein
VANFEKMQQYKQQIEELHTYFTKVITQQADSLSNELIIQGDTCVVFRSTPMAVARVSSGRLAAASISDLDYLNEAQKNILSPVFLPIIDATSYSELKGYTDQLNSRTINSNLSESDKTELLTISAGLWATGRYLENGGGQTIYNEVAKIVNQVPTSGGGNPTGPRKPLRVAGCTVDFRNVWLGASIGFFTGAAGGFYTGATAGTVVVPIIGTVTGAVSGAVAAGAAGFVGGAISGVASELLGSCFRNQGGNGGNGCVSLPTFGGRRVMVCRAQ